MDVMTLAGIILAAVAILGGNMLEGGHISSLILPTAMLIVFGGTLACVMVQFPMGVVLDSMKKVVWVFFPPKLAPQEAIEKIVNWSNIARKEGLLGLEGVAESEADPFARKGLQLLVDGSEPESIRGILEVELDTKEHQDTLAAKVFEGMGGYAPTIGIIGAVMGLIHVMNNLADPSKLGSGIATAFVATIYGVGSANIFFLPFSTKIKGLIHDQTKFREMIIEGVISIAEGENPRNIETKLQGYIH